jgi:hypothetical protein
MNEDNIAALDQSIGHDVSCWLATLPVPTTYGEYNLFACQASLCCFGRRRGKVQKMKKEGIQSRQKTNGIQIPTSSPAVVHEWTNVRQLLQLWAWEVANPIYRYP